jgi:hypothetical protein
MMSKALALVSPEVLGGANAKNNRTRSEFCKIGSVATP